MRKSKIISILLILIFTVTCIQTLFVFADTYSGKVARTKHVNPPKTDLVSAILDNGKVVLTWEKTKGAEGYQIFYANEKNGKFVLLAKVSRTKTSYEVDAVKEGTWYYKIRTYIKVDKKVNYGKFSNTKSIIINTVEPTSVVTNIPEKVDENEKVMINISISDKKYTVILEKNDTAKALTNQLPLTINMSELNGNEKYIYLKTNLRVDESTCPETIHAGDIMLYGDNCLVLFYKTFSTTYPYVKIGHIDDTKSLVDAVGTGDVHVVFSD